MNKGTRHSICSLAAVILGVSCSSGGGESAPPSDGRLEVLTTSTLHSVAPVGGPASPASKSFVLTNAGTDPVSWSVASDHGWVIAAPVSGDLAAGARVDVVARIAAGASTTLGAGVHRATLSFTGQRGAAAVKRAVTLSVEDAGSGLVLDPKAAFEAVGPIGGPFVPARQAYVIRNPGTASRSWTASSSVAWLALSASAGTLAGGEQVAIDVDVAASATAGMAPGVHAGELIVSDATSGTSMSRGVTLALGAAVALEVDPASDLDTAGPPGGPFVPASQSYTVRNAGSEVLNWTAVAAEPWLAVNPSSGALAPGAQRAVDVRVEDAATASMAVGIHVGQVEFRDTGTGAEESRDVRLALGEDDPLRVTAQAFATTGPAGGPFSPASLEYVVSNRGAEPLNWNVVVPEPWLRAAPMSGSLTAGEAVVVTLDIDAAATSSLTAGNHGASVQFLDVTHTAAELRDVTLTITSSVGGVVLQPGTGFAGPTPHPDRVGSGPGADADTIARWDVVPFQRLDGQFQVGVVAFHANGIDRVEFSLEGGAWAGVTSMSHNARTGVNEYWAVVDPNLVADGPIEVRAIAYPNVGDPRLLESLRLIANGGGSRVQHSRHVSNTGSDDFGDGSPANPFGSIMRALESIQIANGTGNADGGVVYLQRGNHTFGPLDAAPRSVTSNEWVTIRPAPGVTKMECAINAFGRVDTKLVHLSDLTIRAQVSTTNNGDVLPEDFVWVDQCDMVGFGRLTNTTFFQQFHWTGIYVTDSLYRDNEDGQEGARLMRNVRVENISSDAFGDSRLVLNCAVDGINPDGTSNHPDVFQFSGVGQTKENYIVYGLQASNCRSQSIFADDLAILNNVAFVNVLVDQIDESYKSQWKDVATNHLLLWNVTLLGQEFTWRTPNVTNASVKGNLWWRMTGIAPATDFRSNHFIDGVSAAALTPGVDVTIGDAGLVDPAGGDYSPSSSSVLKARLTPRNVGVDVLNRQRGEPSSVGAVE